MPYDFEVKEIPAMTLLAERTTCGHHEIGAKLGEIFPHAARRAGHFMAGPPTCLYHAWRETDCDLEAGIPVSGEPDLFGNLTISHIPAHTAVTVVHSGGYDRLSEAHTALSDWAREHGKEVAGPPWESYIDDPDEVGMSQARTLVGWPIR
jgi:effector-binding domain-containing protein